MKLSSALVPKIKKDRSINILTHPIRYLVFVTKIEPVTGDPRSKRALKFCVWMAKKVHVLEDRLSTLYVEFEHFLGSLT